jgi:NAD+ synthase
MAHAIKDNFKLALAQLNAVVGDLDGNLKKAREARARAAEAGADLIAFTELFLTGYPIEDLVLKPALQNARAGFARRLPGIRPTAAPPFSWGCHGAIRRFVYNAVALLDSGRIAQVRYKAISRTMACSTRSGCSHRARCRADRLRGIRLGVPVCEDIWSEVCEGAEASGCRAADRAQRLAYWIDKQDVRTASPGTRGRNELAACLCQSGWRAGRARVDVAPSCSTTMRTSVQLPAWEENDWPRQWRRENGRWRCLPGLVPRSRKATPRTISPALSGCATTCERTVSLRVVLQALGRHRLGAVCGDGRRCAGASPRARRDAALHLYQQ